MPLLCIQAIFPEWGTEMAEQPQRERQVIPQDVPKLPHTRQRPSKPTAAKFRFDARLRQDLRNDR
jgi:hypothetical protein